MEPFFVNTSLCQHNFDRLGENFVGDPTKKSKIVLKSQDLGYNVEKQHKTYVPTIIKKVEKNASFPQEEFPAANLLTNSPTSDLKQVNPIR